MPRTKQSNDGRNGEDEGQICPTPAPIAVPGPPTYVLRTNSCACLKAAVFASRGYPTKNGTVRVLNTKPASVDLHLLLLFHSIHLLR